MKNEMNAQQFGDAFSGEIHRPFHFDGGDTAVVLVHGFPGTPAETRGLGKRLQSAGLTARGLLLPGFGPEIDRLFDHTRQDWVRSVVQAVEEVRKSHRKVFLFGYSFGGAVSVHAALETQIDGLVLAAPFWRIGGKRERAIWSVMRHIMPSFRPFKNINFNIPQIAEGMARMMPGVDIRDESVQAGLRNVRVPAGIVDEVMGLGAAARTCACDLRAPVLVLQGLRDEVISRANTREFAAAFTPEAAYEEVDSDHGIINPLSPAFEEVAEKALAFIRKNGG